MSLIDRMRKQVAVYWPPSAPDAFGQPTWGSPVELRVRWEDVSKEFISDQGSVSMSNALVYVPEVSAGVECLPRGVLMLGELDSSVNTDDPKANEGAWEIKRFDKLPTINAKRFLRTCFL